MLRHLVICLTIGFILTGVSIGLGEFAKRSRDPGSSILTKPFGASRGEVRVQGRWYTWRISRRPGVEFIVVYAGVRPLRAVKNQSSSAKPRWWSRVMEITGDPDGPRGYGLAMFEETGIGWPLVVHVQRSATATSWWDFTLDDIRYGQRPRMKTREFIWVGFVGNIVFYALAAWPIIAAGRWLIGRVHMYLAWRRGTKCRCGYDLRGTRSSRCSECGEVVQRETQTPSSSR